ncbi:hypothetical protein IAT40_005201 [Kwoniella sp. CBS 6097]
MPEFENVPPNVTGSTSHNLARPPATTSGPTATRSGASALSPSHRAWVLIRRHMGTIPVVSDMQTESELYPGSTDDPHNLNSAKTSASQTMKDAELTLLKRQSLAGYWWDGESGVAEIAREQFDSENASLENNPSAVGTYIATEIQMSDYRKMRDQETKGATDGLIVFDDMFQFNNPNPESARLYVTPNTNPTLMDVSKARLRRNWADLTKPPTESTDWTGIGLLRVDRTTLNLPFLEKVSSVHHMPSWCSYGSAIPNADVRSSPLGRYPLGDQ